MIIIIMIMYYNISDDGKMNRSFEIHIDMFMHLNKFNEVNCKIIIPFRAEEF